MNLKQASNSALNRQKHLKMLAPMDLATVEVGKRSKVLIKV